MIVPYAIEAGYELARSAALTRRQLDPVSEIHVPECLRDNVPVEDLMHLVHELKCETTHRNQSIFRRR